LKQAYTGRRSFALVKSISKTATLLLAILGSVLPLTTAWAGDEPAVEGEEHALPYLRAVHAKVHPLWAGNFLSLAASQLPKDHPINTPSRRAELEVLISSKGTLLDARVAKTSGASEFDASAMEVVRAAGDFAPAPEEILSDDGKVHLLWTFARDDRRCSGLAITHRDLPLAEAVRALVGQTRHNLAIARLQAADDSERAAGMDAFARAWLDHNEHGKDYIDVLVALANALAGDDRGVERLRQAVAMADVSESIPKWGARGLVALKIPTCPLLKAAFAKTLAQEKGAPSSLATEPSDEQFLRDVQAKGMTFRILQLLDAGADGVCLSLAIATAKNRAANKDLRASAVLSLAHSDGPDVKAAWKTLAKDPDPAIASQAITAEARPSAGRGAMFRLTPLLRDKSVAVRAAAAAALVRVGGEEVLPQLFLIYKEKSPSIYVALAAELAKLSGAASAEMLGRLLKKDNYEIRATAARALAARRDEHAAKVQATLATADRPELQLLSGLALAKEKRDAAVRAQADDGFHDSYSALLRGSARVVAADWLLAHFSEFSPASRAELLGEWLATRPKSP
jgi:TonB family protein